MEVINVKDRNVDTSSVIRKGSSNKSIDEESATLEIPVKNIQPVQADSTNKEEMEAEIIIILKKKAKNDR